MSANTIELSSDDSEDSVRSARYFHLPTTEIYSVEDLQESKAGTSTSGTSSSQDNGGKPRRKKNDSTENGVTKKLSGAERQALKKKLADEKKAAKEANKIYKPGECIKYMIIEMHPKLLGAWYCADLEREASASGVKVRASIDICDKDLVLWSRTVPRILTDNNGMVELTPSEVRCGHGLYVLHAEHVAELVAEHALAEHVERTARLAGCRLTLVLFGIRVKGPRRKNVERIISENDLQKAIADLVVSVDCDTVEVNTANELALTIMHFTKAVAEEPSKRSRRAVDERAQFYMRGDNKKCVAVDTHGNGLGRLWQQMLAVLPHASLDSARALCTQHPSPLTLYEALRSPGGERALADVGVARAAAPGSKTRRIGPEFARKMRILLTATDGDTLLD